ncbi:MAG TPA: aminotransferase class V-fold PLP-dependent enzyme [candidate division Zixibacteria bacterium]|nr:aminotransferase class V-fold PLP-dependent enzyme [candidate division Zixibacteria bacterium]
MPGRPFLLIPGPALIPERISRAMSQSLIDHRGPEFACLLREVLDGLKRIFQTSSAEIILCPGSGTGAWESCVVNTLSPGDRVLGCVNGHFSERFCDTARAHGIEVEEIEVPYGAAIPAETVHARLESDARRDIKAVLVLHNETSTGVVNDIAAIRRAMDRCGHPALLLVDVVSSLASIDFRFDEWRVDVALTGAQKGLMLPPGMAILAVSAKALEANRSARCSRYFWDWAPVLERNARGEFPFTPATALIFGLKESLAMLEEEGLANVFARHARLAEACRRAVQSMGLSLLARKPEQASNTLTAVCMPEGLDADAYLAHARRTLELPLGPGLGNVKGKIFRIGHLGSLNELELLGALAGIEMTLTSFGVPVPLGAGLAAAETYLLRTASGTGSGR